MKRTIRNSLFLFLVLATVALSAAAQDTIATYRLNLVKHPVTKKYGYAFKEQNINSPIRGMASTALNLLGTSAMISKKEADHIDWAVPPQYDDAAKQFRENLAMVKVGGKVGFIDPFNRFEILPVYDDADDLYGFSHGLAAVKKDGKWGFIDKSGRMVIEARYEEVEHFHDNLLAPVRKDGKWGAIDLLGHEVVPCAAKVKAAMITMPGTNKAWRAAAKEAKEKQANGTYDSRLRELREASERVNKHIRREQPQALTYTVREGIDSLGVTDQFGRYIVPAGFSKVKHDKGANAFIVERDGKFGAYLYNGARLIPPCFDSMGAFKAGRSQVRVAGVSGWIDTDGNLSPNLLSDLAKKGMAEEEAGKDGAARLLYERLLEINPEYAPAYNNIALLDIANKDYNKGISKLKLAAKLDPDNATISKNLEWAKENRKERRHDRWMAGLSIVGALVGAAATTYSTYSSIKGGGSAVSTTGADPGAYADTGGTGGKSKASGGKSKASGGKSCNSCKGSGKCFSGGMKSCQGRKTCQYCLGKGYDYTAGHAHECGACKGTGKCHFCDGTGICKRCKGTGKV